MLMLLQNVLMQEFLVALGLFPRPCHMGEAAGALHMAGDGADFAVDRIIGALLALLCGVVCLVSAIAIWDIVG